MQITNIAANKIKLLQIKNVAANKIELLQIKSSCCKINKVAANLK